MMALVSIVPIIVAGFLTIWSIVVSHRENVARLEGAVIEEIYSELNGFMYNNVNAIRIIITFENEAARKEGGVQYKDQVNLVTRFFGSNTPLNFEEVSLISLEGIETVRFTKDYPSGVSFEDLRDQSGVYKFTAAKSRENYVSDVYYTLRGPMVTVSAPTTDKEGNIFFVISGELNLSYFKNIFKEKKLGDAGYAYLVDKDGFVIAGLGDDPPMASLKNLGLVRSLVAGKNFIGLEKQQRYKNFFGETVVAAGKFLPEYSWGLVVEWPAKEADATINDILYKNILVLLAVVVGVVFASVILSARIVKPIRKLEQGTERIAEGRFEEEIKIKTGDEIQELGEAFNKMMLGLKRLEELKDEFVFIAAHELRTPVAAMKGYLSLILDGTTGVIGEKTKDFIRKVVHANDRLVQLVNDLLEVSRSEAGKLTIKVSSIDLTGAIHDVLTELEKMAEEKGVEIIHEVLPNMPKVLADPDRAKEVLVNLVGNTIKYMGGSGKVNIFHEVEGNMLITHIKDTGLGMSEEAQKKLFEKFYRVATDKTREITGTGLGLFIVKEIMEKMGGKVWAYSEGDGKGSTFSFSLPMA